MTDDQWLMPDLRQTGGNRCIRPLQSGIRHRKSAIPPFPIAPQNESSAADSWS